MGGLGTSTARQECSASNLQIIEVGEAHQEETIIKQSSSRGELAHMVRIPVKMGTGRGGLPTGAGNLAATYVQCMGSTEGNLHSVQAGV